MKLSRTDLMHLNDDELAAQIAIATDVDERRRLQLLLTRRQQMASPDTAELRQLESAQRIARWQALTLRQKLSACFAFMLLVLPLLLFRQYVHQQDSFLPSLWWMSSFIGAGIGLVIFARWRLVQLFGFGLLLSVTAGLPRWLGQQLHPYVAGTVTMKLFASSVAEQPLAPRCNGYIEFDAPHHLVGWSCNIAPTTLKRWQTGQYYQLGVQHSWFGISFKRPDE